MTTELVFRLIVMVVVAILGWNLGTYLQTVFADYQQYYTYVLSVVGALIGFLIAPSVTVRPFKAIGKAIRQLPARFLIVGSAGLVLGLIVSALADLPSGAVIVWSIAISAIIVTIVFRHKSGQTG